MLGAVGKESPGIFGTQDWTRTGFYFNSGDNTEVIIAANLGDYYGRTTGTAWFDDVSKRDRASGGGWWPSPADTDEDRDPTFDSVKIVGGVHDFVDSSRFLSHGAHARRCSTCQCEKLCWAS